MSEEAKWGIKSFPHNVEIPGKTIFSRPDFMFMYCEHKAEHIMPVIAQTANYRHQVLYIPVIRKMRGTFLYHWILKIFKF